jgi:hypothetical protein
MADLVEVEELMVTPEVAVAVEVILEVVVQDKRLQTVLVEVVEAFKH